MSVLTATLTSSEATTAEQQAEQLAESIDDGVISAECVVEDREEEIVQLQLDGAVVASSDDDALAPLPREGRADTEEGQVITASAETELGDVEYVVVVARELDAVSEATTTVAALLALLLPILTAGIALIVWLVVGRALRPVERIRRDVDAISSAQLNRRVDVPATGDEVAELAKTMNRMLERLDEAQSAQRRFLSDASHELRSPIASLVQHAELAQHHPTATDLSTLADVVGAESGRMAELVDSMLSLARAEESSMPRGPVDLDDLALAEASRLRTLCSLSIDVKGVSAVRTTADAPAMARALRNLSENARRHARTRIALSTFIDGEKAVIAVDDDGPGIPEEERRHVLERFHRLDEARSRDAGGSGLGLAIVAGMAAAHEGDVRVLDSLLGGARIEIRLPLSSD
ncbi:sensor histidine kinase [Microcella sp.]|uniref:sensor histidine kinase n=1 Tax=Microcella sp. TaxID=1913979 RepID=UPI003F70221E